MNQVYPPTPHMQVWSAILRFLDRKERFQVIELLLMVGDLRPQRRHFLFQLLQFRRVTHDLPSFQKHVPESCGTPVHMTILPL
jgi:hypothetical protein